MPTLFRVLFPVSLLALLPSPAAGQVTAITDCEPEGPARPICGFQNPEDLVALPGGEAILVSEYGGMEGDIPGALALLPLDTEERRELFRGGDADGAEPVWGDPACPGPPPPAFSPHGIHLSERDGALQLLGRAARRARVHRVLRGHRRGDRLERGLARLRRGPRVGLAQLGGGAARRGLRDHPHDDAPAGRRGPALGAPAGRGPRARLRARVAAGARLRDPRRQRGRHAQRHRDLDRRQPRLRERRRPGPPHRPRDRRDRAQRDAGRSRQRPLGPPTAACWSPPWRARDGTSWPSASTSRAAPAPSASASSPSIPNRWRSRSSTPTRGRPWAAAPSGWWSAGSCSWARSPETASCASRSTEGGGGETRSATTLTGAR